MAAWPKKRGPPTHPTTKQQNNWLAWTAKAMAYVAPSQMEAAREATDNKLKYARDLLTQAAAGNLYDIEDENGNLLSRHRREVHKQVLTGIRLQRTANLTLSAGVLTTVSWPTPLIDTAGFYDAANPSRITIPEGIQYVNLKTSGVLDISTTTRWALFVTDKNGNAWAGQDTNVDGTRSSSCDTGVIEVAEGDWFEAKHLALATRTLLADARTFFCLHVLGTNFG